MRIGGPFPFNAAQSFVAPLAGGSYFYPPAGNWLFQLDANAAMQWWDPIAWIFRGIVATGHVLPISVDGYNYRVVNTTSGNLSAAVTAAGSGGTNGIGPVQTNTNVVFNAAPAGGRTSRGYAIVGGALPALTVAVPGTGFLVPPLILIDPPPPGGIQATAVATITAGGALNTATLVNVGAGYAALPQVYVVPQFLDYPGAPTLPNNPANPVGTPPGIIQLMPPQRFAQGLQPSFPVPIGALVNFGAGVLAGSGTLTGVVVTDIGAGYTVVGTITFTGTGAPAAATATATFGGAAASSNVIMQAAVNE
jgi:hypothetical protein